jgi:hypothetical protein
MTENAYSLLDAIAVGDYDRKVPQCTYWLHLMLGAAWVEAGPDYRTPLVLTSRGWEQYHAGATLQ